MGVLRECRCEQVFSATSGPILYSRPGLCSLAPRDRARRVVTGGRVFSAFGRGDVRAAGAANQAATRRHLVAPRSPVGHAVSTNGGPGSNQGASLKVLTRVRDLGRGSSRLHVADRLT